MFISSRYRYKYRLISSRYKYMFIRIRFSSKSSCKVVALFKHDLTG